MPGPAKTGKGPAGKNRRNKVGKGTTSHARREKRAGKEMKQPVAPEPPQVDEPCERPWERPVWQKWTQEEWDAWKATGVESWRRPAQASTQPWQRRQWSQQEWDEWLKQKEQTQQSSSITEPSPTTPSPMSVEVVAAKEQPAQEAKAAEKASGSAPSQPAQKATAAAPSQPAQEAKKAVQPTETAQVDALGKAEETVQPSQPAQEAKEAVQPSEPAQEDALGKAKEIAQPSQPGQPSEPAQVDALGKAKETVHAQDEAAPDPNKAKLIVDWFGTLWCDGFIPHSHLVALKALLDGGYTVAILSYCGAERAKEVQQLAKQHLPCERLAGVFACCQRVGPKGKGQWAKDHGYSVIFDDQKDVGQDCSRRGLSVFPIRSQKHDHRWAKRSFGNFPTAVMAFLESEGTHCK